MLLACQFFWDFVSLKKIWGFIFYAVSLLRRRVGEQVVKQMVDDLNLDNSIGPLSAEIWSPPVTSPNILGDFERQMRRITNPLLSASNSGRCRSSAGPTTCTDRFHSFKELKLTTECIHTSFYIMRHICSYTYAFSFPAAAVGLEN